MNSKVFDGEVEIDESHLFKEKHSFAPHRNYALGSVWIFGICKRKSSDFIFFPVTSREEENLLQVIFRFIKPRSIIYSDSFSCYVNNRVFPKKSKLAKYEYIHYFINHKKEFVSPLFKKMHTNNIENLWKQLKQQIRKDGITKMYIPAIARFYFFKTLCNEEQYKIIKKGLHSKTIESKENLIDSILSRF